MPYRFMKYAGLTPDEYDACLPRMRADNLRPLRIFALVAAVLALGMFLSTFVSGTFGPSRLGYLVGGLVCAGIAIAAFICKDGYLADELVYLFVLALYGMGIATGTILEPNELSVLFVAFLLVLPVLFTMRPQAIVSLQVPAVVLFVVLAVLYKDDHLVSVDITDALLFGAVGLLLGVFNAQTRLRTYALSAEVHRLSVTDVLTGLGNRRAFEDQVERIQRSGQQGQTTLVSADVNSLKWVNDTLGHEAGDRLLKAAGDCLRCGFGAQGQVYRLGGDEFAVISQQDPARVQELMDGVRSLCLKWKDKEISQLNIALGCASGRDFPGEDMEGLMKEADKGMYADKTRFYESTGHDRRR